MGLGGFGRHRGIGKREIRHAGIGHKTAPASLAGIVETGRDLIVTLLTGATIPSVSALIVEIGRNKLVAKLGDGEI